jgi:hypothetical protein
VDGDKHMALTLDLPAGSIRTLRAGKKWKRVQAS